MITKFIIKITTVGNFANKIDSSKELVYTSYELNEVFENKYEVRANIPVININHQNALNIDKEISSIFYNKVNSILAEAKKEGARKALYTVSYSAYLNQNILSLVIRANLKEGDNPQRTIIKSYNYNLSTNQEITLSEMLGIKGVTTDIAQKKIKEEVEEAIKYTESLSSLGYSQYYQRDIDSDIYKVEKSDNYFIGPNESIYIIYAYGNASFTTENDIVYIK